MFENERLFNRLARRELTLEAAMAELCGKRSVDLKGRISIGQIIAVQHGDTAAPEILCHGFRDIDSCHPVQQNDLFRVYSVTKMFTAALITRLCQRTLPSDSTEPPLSLESPVLPLLQSIYETAPDKEKVILERLIATIDPRATVHDLLKHRAGIGTFSNNPEFLQEVLRTPGKSHSFYELLHYTEPCPVSYGEFFYSDSGYLLLGLIAEHCGRCLFEEQVRQICDEHHFGTTFFLKDALPHVGEGKFENDQVFYLEKSITAPQPSALAHGYTVMNQSTLELTSSMEHDTGKSAGGMLSTVSDTLRWAPVFYHSYSPNDKITPMHADSKDGIDDYAYGYGMKRIILDGETWYGHGGDARGGYVRVYYNPERNTSIAIFETWENLTATIAKKVLKSEDAGTILQSAARRLKEAYTDEKTGIFQRTQMASDWVTNRDTLMEKAFPYLMKTIPSTPAERAR